MGEDDFIAPMTMVKNVAGILWATQRSGEKSPQPVLRLVTGFVTNLVLRAVVLDSMRSLLRQDRPSR